MEKKKQMIEVTELELAPIADDDLAAIKAAQENLNCNPDGGGGGGGGGDDGAKCSEWWCLWYPGEN